MAKRRCTMTAEVLERWDDLGKDLEMGSSDEMSDDDQLKFPEDEEWDDPDEPIMEGSDDEFSDLGKVDDEHNDTFYILAPQVLILLKCTPLLYLFHRLPLYLITFFYIPSCYNPSKHLHTN